MLTSTVKFKLGGREVSPSQFRSGFKDAILEAAREQLRQQVERVVCAVHGQHAEVASIEVTATGWSYSIHGCCDALKQEVRRSLSE